MSEEKFTFTKEEEASFDNTKVGSMVPIRLKELRIRHGLTQTELGEVLDVSTREYWRYEQQGYNTNYINLLALAAFYNVSLDWIFGLIEVERPVYTENDKLRLAMGTVEQYKEYKKQKAEAKK